MSTKASSFHIPRQNPKSEIRLVCFPYAGGQANSFARWPQYFPPAIELVLVQYPGRGPRYSEPLCDSIDALSKHLHPDFMDLLNRDEKPYLFFGHSFGSRIAFELALNLVSSGCRPPLHFIASAGKAPHAHPPHRETMELSDSELLGKLVKLGGEFSIALQHPEILEIYLPIIRADFAANDGYFRAPDEKLACAATILGGRDDHAVLLEHLQLWPSHFARQVDFILYDGGHFLIESHIDDVIADILAIIDTHARMS